MVDENGIVPITATLNMTIVHWSLGLRNVSRFAPPTAALIRSMTRGWVVELSAVDHWKTDCR